MARKSRRNSRTIGAAARKSDAGGLKEVVRWASSTPAFKGESAAKAVKVVLDSKTARSAVAQVRVVAKKQGVSADTVDQLFATLRNRAIEQARDGSAFLPSNLTSELAQWQLISSRLGTVSSVGRPALLAQIAGDIPTILMDSHGGTVDPDSKLGQSILIIDIVMEIIGALLLLVNVALPALNWGAATDLIERMGPTALNKFLEAIAYLGTLLSSGAGLEDILKAAIKILTLAWASENIWEIIKKLLDLPWYEWLELITKFALLTALELGLDSLSAGCATAAKLALVSLALLDIFAKKVPKLKA